VKLKGRKKQEGKEERGGGDRFKKQKRSKLVTTKYG